MSGIILKSKMLCKTFFRGGLQYQILKNLNLDIKEGDFTVIMGASGSGKSTLLYALSGMDRPTLGEVYFRNEEITRYSNDRLAVFRRKNCGFVFQQICLLNTMSILDNCLVNGLLVNKNKRVVINKAKELLTQVGLEEAQWNKFPSQLSGGEAQRVGIVRSLMNEPSMIFADEPTGSLNSGSSKAVLDLLSEVNHQGQSILMVTHDIKTAIRGNRILYLRDGVICGECMLGSFPDINSKRQEQLTSFLTNMGW
ncbi:MAG: transporter ATP-binding protein [Herbinix sp.]|jgi:putative ABC transport system ATP-binding protein|nr:transporter ATP-binding protein [Herbinix sp.]